MAKARRKSRKKSRKNPIHRKRSHRKHRKNPARKRRAHRKHRAHRKNPRSGYRKHRRVHRAHRKNPSRRRRHRRNPIGKFTQKAFPNMKPDALAAPAPRRRRGKKSASSGALVSIKKQLSSINSALKRSKGKSKASRASRSVMRARQSALRIQKRIARKKMPGVAAKAAIAHGLKRVNPGSVGAVVKDVSGNLVQLAPMAGVFAAAMVGSFYLGGMISEKAKSWTKSDGSPVMPQFVQQYSGTISAGVTAVALYGAARAVKPLQKWSLAILMGGIAAMVVKAMQEISVGGDSIASKVGLAGLGEYVSVDGVVVTKSGVPVTFGKYVTAGYVTAGMGSIFEKPKMSTLGALPGRTTPDPFAPDPLRDASRGTLHEQHLSKLEAKIERGSTLSGGIFND